MNLYKLDTTRFASDILPNVARVEPDKSALKSVLVVAKNTNIIFNDKLEGADLFSGVVIWAVGTYSMGNKVIYFNDGSVYECIVNSTTDIPTNGTSWLKIAESFIGYNESKNFNGSKKILEYALNRRFFTQFYNAPSNSDIYVDPTISVPYPFHCGDGVGISSGSFDGVGFEGAPDGFTPAFDSSFTIFIPVALSVDLGVEYDKIIRTFVNKYITAGVSYTITTY